MYIRQLITVSSLFLSQASAKAVLIPTDGALKSFAMAMTPTDTPLEKTPQFKNVAEALKDVHSVDTHQMEHLSAAITPIMEHHQKEISEIYGAFVGFHETIGSKKAQEYPQETAEAVSLYRACIYSNLKAIVETKSGHLSRERLTNIEQQLRRLLNPKGGVNHSGHTHATLEKAAQEIFKIKPTDIQQMPTAEINQRLRQLGQGNNLNPLLISETHYKNFLKHLYSSHFHPAAPHTHAHPIAVA